MLSLRRLIIPALTDPFDAPDVLERYAHEPGFLDRWRAFIRACSLVLLPGLPREAREWLGAADEYEQGASSPDRLAEVRQRAWQFHDARRDSSPLAELSGLRAVMYRLSPKVGVERWHESAWHFLQFCDEAGLREEVWFPLLKEQFPDILG